MHHRHSSAKKHQRSWRRSSLALGHLLIGNEVQNDDTRKLLRRWRSENAKLQEGTGPPQSAPCVTPPLKGQYCQARKPGLDSASITAR